MYSLEFYETDPRRDFVRGSKWNLMPMPGVLGVMKLRADRPFAERWGPAAHQLSRSAGKAALWYANIDDLPEESNSVTLDRSRSDDNGLPAARIRYTMSDNTVKNIDFQRARMQEAHLAAGAVEVYDGGLVPSGHLMGTARMGTDPATSVVDPFGRAHDVPNLFIVDGSVFVTGGAMNPTATIAALALRTAEHIADTAAELPALV